MTGEVLSITLTVELFVAISVDSVYGTDCHASVFMPCIGEYLVCDPTIRQPGFDLPRQQWSLLNHFRTEQGHCGVCRRKWRLTDTDLCPCGETQTMSHIVESRP